MELGSYDLAKIRSTRELNKDIFKNNFSGHIYVWSDFHLNDPEIIYVSGRKYWGTNGSIGLKVNLPDTEYEKSCIIKELMSLENNSIFLNLGDVGKISDIREEDNIRDVNNVLMEKNIYNILLLGNHDYLKDNRFYEILSGHEEEFYKELGFDEVIRNPFIIKTESSPIYLFSHKPIISEVMEELNKNINRKLPMNIKNIHGHWHSFGTIGENRKSVCLDVIDKPLDIKLDNDNLDFLETCLTDDKFFLKDPWI